MSKSWYKKEWKEKREKIIQERNKCELCGISQDESLEKYKCGLVIHHIGKPKSKNNIEFEQYEELNQNEIKILCKKCHFMNHRGFTDLCPECGGYRRHGYSTCYNCSERAKGKVGNEYSEKWDFRQKYFLAWCSICWRVFISKQDGLKPKKCAFNDCKGWGIQLRAYKAVQTAYPEYFPKIPILGECYYILDDENYRNFIKQLNLQPYHAVEAIYE